MTTLPTPAPLSGATASWVRNIHMASITALVGKELMLKRPNQWKIFGAINNGMSQLHMTQQGINVDAMMQNQMLSLQVPQPAAQPHVVQEQQLNETPVVQDDTTQILNLLSKIDERLTKVEKRKPK